MEKTVPLSNVPLTFIQAPRTERDIVAHLPGKDTTLSIMVVTKILSDRGTNGLGDFEVQYLYEPEALEAIERYMHFHQFYI